MSSIGLYAYYLSEWKKSLSDAEKKDICIVDRATLKYFLRDERNKYQLLCKRKENMAEESESTSKKPKRS